MKTLSLRPGMEPVLPDHALRLGAPGQVIPDQTRAQVSEAGCACSSPATPRLATICMHMRPGHVRARDSLTAGCASFIKASSKIGL